MRRRVGYQLSCTPCGIRRLAVRGLRPRGRRRRAVARPGLDTSRGVGSGRGGGLGAAGGTVGVAWRVARLPTADAPPLGRGDSVVGDGHDAGHGGAADRE